MLELTLGVDLTKEYFSTELQTTFEFTNLPLEILELIISSLPARDIMCLFLIDKQIHKWFAKLDNNALWAQILQRSRISLDGDIPMPKMENAKRHFINSGRYVKYSS